jgi:hypothetical protein
MARSGNDLVDADLHSKRADPGRRDPIAVQRVLSHKRGVSISELEGTA